MGCFRSQRRTGYQAPGKGSGTHIPLAKKAEVDFHELVSAADARGAHGAGVDQVFHGPLPLCAVA